LTLFVPLNKIAQGGIDTKPNKKKRDIRSLLEGYDLNNLSHGTCGSHSALDVCSGAQQEGLANFVLVKKGRHRTYDQMFRERYHGSRKVGCVQEICIVDSWNEILGEKVTNWTRERNGIINLNRSWAVYLRNKQTGYGPIFEIDVPYFGNPYLVEAEERAAPYKIEHNQDFLAKKSNLPVPETFSTPEAIDRPVLIKASQFSEKRDFARDFIIVKSPEEYYEKLRMVVNNAPASDKEFVESAFRSAPIQEFVRGDLLINLNFFFSATWKDLEFLGADTRRQFGNGEEATHIPISLRESLLEQVVNMGWNLVETVAEYYPQGLVGPFAIQCMGDAKESLRPIDLSLRMPGSPDAGATPYPIYLYGERIDFGRRCAMEIKDAVQEGTLEMVLG
jgi:5-formaminoimidazole-4-carboxamide-1-(beta)-D-ribofuranosyl 5'-monophosphate synthetase